MKRVNLCRAIGAVVDAINALDDAAHSDEDRDALKTTIDRLDNVVRDLDYALTAPERDEEYERAAARARNNDFADTNGRDWT